MKAIETIGLTKHYGSARGIEQVNLSVEQGDFLGFIGPNGAGKSTTIRLLLGLLHPTEGKATVLGADVGKDSTKILSQIGYLPSEINLYGRMKVKDVIKFSANLRNMDCTQEAVRLCERLQLDTERKINELSLGNRKKVGMVCALQHKPALYIMDEPTSGLDPLMQREFYQIMKERNNEGATVFLSSHALSEVEKHCTHAAVISNGTLLACDNIERFGHTGAKRVCLRGVRSPLCFEHIYDMKNDGTTVSFLYRGDVNQLLFELRNCQFEDLTISDTDLEDVFFQFYQKEDE